MENLNKAAIMKIVVDNKQEHERFYINNGPNKHEQEDHYRTGVSVVAMDVALLADWLCSLADGEALAEAFGDLPKADRREIWEASDFHHGIMGYKDHDADFYWEHEES